MSTSQNHLARFLIMALHKDTTNNCDVANSDCIRYKHLKTSKNIRTIRYSAHFFFSFIYLFCWLTSIESLMWWCKTGWAWKVWKMSCELISRLFAGIWLVWGSRRHKIMSETQNSCSASNAHISWSSSSMFCKPSPCRSVTMILITLLPCGKRVARYYCIAIYGQYFLLLMYGRKCSIRGPDVQALNQKGVCSCLIPVVLGRIEE